MILNCTPKVVDLININWYIEKEVIEMNILQIVISIFVFIECLNVLVLYIKPDFKMGNSIGVFNQYQSLKDNEFVSYLINWVAGSKLIFIMMGIVSVAFGDQRVHLFSTIALIISILSFYWRLFPTIKKLDAIGEIKPKGYAKTLNLMILSFLSMFAIALVIYFLF
jgi:hypothetical protein